MTWKHYPDSPFGDVDICEHGYTRGHVASDVHEPVCVDCDYPEDTLLAVMHCNPCNSGTWHKDGVCVICGSTDATAFFKDGTNLHR